MHCTNIKFKFTVRASKVAGLVQTPHPHLFSCESNFCLYCFTTEVKELTLFGVLCCLAGGEGTRGHNLLCDGKFKG
jgi:hypothetical protein